MKNFVLATLACVACSSVATAQLFGLDSSTPGTVYTVDPSTGVATPYVNLSGASLSSITDIEFLNGVAYACDIATDSGWSFGSIDLNTGAFTTLNNQGGSANWWALAANTAANLLYTVDFNNNNDFLSITPAGVITTIGNTGIAMGGMTYDDNAGVLYATTGTDLYTINVATGAPTLIGSLGVTSDNASDLAFDEITNTLYFNSSSNALYTVNTSTGAATLVGANGFGNPPPLDGLGWNAPVPEPASMLALGGGLMLLLRRRKR